VTVSSCPSADLHGLASEWLGRLGANIRRDICRVTRRENAGARLKPCCHERPKVRGSRSSAPESGGGQRHVGGLILVIAPLGGFSGRFGGYGYGYGGGVLGVTLDRSP
jgi:hypothetical protein